MKKGLILFLLLLEPVFMQSWEGYKNGHFLLFGDSVTIRQEPDTNSKKVDVFSIGTPVEVLSNTGCQLMIAGTNDYWYNVRINNKIGYLWGALISDQWWEYDSNQDSKNKILILTRTIRGGYYDFYNGKIDIHEIRVVRDKKITDQSEDRNFNSISFDKYSGFNENLFLLRCQTTEMYGEGEKYFYLDKEGKLKSVISRDSGGEGGAYRDEKLLFVGDNQIIKRIEDTDSASEPNINRVTEEYYYWDITNKTFNQYKTEEVK